MAPAAAWVTGISALFNLVAFAEGDPFQIVTFPLTVLLAMMAGRRGARRGKELASG